MNQPFKIDFFYRGLFVIGFTYFATVLFIVPVVRKLALKLRWVDDPVESSRKIHKNIVPYLGGVAIYIGMLLGLGVLLMTLQGSDSLYTEKILTKWLPAYFTGGGLVLTIGTIDDIYDIRPSRKLFAQVAIAFLLYLSGVRLDYIILPFWGMVEFGHLSAIMTICFIVIFMNAVNLVDGLDGLAGSIVLVVLLANFFLGMYLGNVPVAILCAILFSAVFGFMRYNWYPAKIFLGDGGSLVLGCFAGILAIENISVANKFSEVVLSLIAMLYPIMDICIAITRRILKGKPIMSADKAHIHHRLIKIGLSQVMITKIIIFLSAIFVLGCLMCVLGWYILGVLVLSVSFLFFILGLLALGYFDLSSMCHTIKMRPLLKKHNAYKTYVVLKMKYSNTVDELWACLVDAARTFNIIKLEWAGNNYQKSWGMADTSVVYEKHRVCMKNTKDEITFFLLPHDDEHVSSEIELLMNTLINQMDKALSNIWRK